MSYPVDRVNQAQQDRERCDRHSHGNNVHARHLQRTGIKNSFRNRPAIYRFCEDPGRPLNARGPSGPNLHTARRTCRRARSQRNAVAGASFASADSGRAISAFGLAKRGLHHRPALASGPRGSRARPYAISCTAHAVSDARELFAQPCPDRWRLERVLGGHAYTLAPWLCVAPGAAIALCDGCWRDVMAVSSARADVPAQMGWGHEPLVLAWSQHDDLAGGVVEQPRDVIGIESRAAFRCGRDHDPVRSARARSSA